MIARVMTPPREKINSKDNLGEETNRQKFNIECNKHQIDRRIIRWGGKRPANTRGIGLQTLEAIQKIINEEARLAGAYGESSWWIACSLVRGSACLCKKTCSNPKTRLYEQLK